MCLGLPARMVADHDDHGDLMVADVSGARRAVNVGLLDQRPAPGDWVLIHMGFALEHMTPQQAADAIAVLAVDDDRLDVMLAERPGGSDLRPD